MLPQNIHDPADYEEMPGKTERDAVSPVSKYTVIQMI